MAFNYNHATLVGRLTKEPEIRVGKNGVSRTCVTLAVNRNFKREDGAQETDYIPIIVWGRTAELAYQILKKGSPVLFWGRIQVRTYEKDEERMWITELVAENFQILERKRDHNPSNLIKQTVPEAA